MFVIFGWVILSFCLNKRVWRCRRLVRSLPRLTQRHDDPNTSTSSVNMTAPNHFNRRQQTTIPRSQTQRNSSIYEGMETKRQLKPPLPTTTEPIPKEGATISNGLWERETRFGMDLDAFGDTLRFVVWPSLPPLSLVNTQLPRPCTDVFMGI